MKRSDTMSLGEFRELTKDMPDNAIIMIVSEMMPDEAVAVRLYPVCTSLDDQGAGIVLLEGDISESVRFTDC